MIYEIQCQKYIFFSLFHKRLNLRFESLALCVDGTLNDHHRSFSLCVDGNVDLK